MAEGIPKSSEAFEADVACYLGRLSEKSTQNSQPQPPFGMIHKSDLILF